MRRFDANYEFVLSEIRKRPGIDVFDLGEAVLLDGITVMAILKRAIGERRISIKEMRLYIREES